MPQRRARTTRVSESLAKRIQRQIVAGRLKAGEKLPAEREMARKHNTSRVSVREAYRSLEELGLLTIRRGAEGGAFIAQIGHGAVQKSLSLVLRLGRVSHAELTEARLLIEPPVARLAALRATPEDIARLRAAVDRQETLLVKKGDYRPTNMVFHRMLAECSHNLPLMTLMNALIDLMVELVTKVAVPRHVQEGVCHFHRLILEAIERHDENAAHTLMLNHIGQIQGGIGETLAKHLQGNDGNHSESNATPGSAD